MNESAQRAEQLRGILETALNDVPAYAAWRRFDPGGGVSVDLRLACLPALSKAQMRTCGYAGLLPPGRDAVAALTRGEIELVHTNGTTGDRVANIWCQPWWDAAERASWELHATAQRVATGAHLEAILTSPFCAGVPCEDGYLSRQQRTLGRFLYLNERSDPATWTEAHMERMILELNEFRPAVLEGNPSFLAWLARHAVHRGHTPAPPGLLVLTYENPSPLQRRQMAATFGCPLASSYGSTEAGYVFMECEAGRLHQNTASCHVDFLPFRPEHGGPLLGRILVTTLDNPWRVLLRFDIGDVVRLADTPCPCGRRDGLTLAASAGRCVNLTLTPAGNAVTEHQVDLALASIAGLAEYRLEQTAAAVYRVQVMAEAKPPAALAAAVEAALHGVYGGAASIAVLPVAAIHPDPPGKFRRTRALFTIDPDRLLEPGSVPPVCVPNASAQGQYRLLPIQREIPRLSRGYVTTGTGSTQR